MPILPNTSINLMHFKLKSTFLEFDKVKESEVAQSCPTLCGPVVCSPPVSSIRGIFQARVQECASFEAKLLARVVCFPEGKKKKKRQSFI